MIVRSVDLTSQRVAPAVAEHPSRRRPAPTVAWLVHSADRGTREVVLDAVRRAGHDGHASFTRRASPLGIATSGYRFAFLDLCHPVGGVADVDGWVACLALHRCRLVIRGGGDDDERWARERGAVAYLPGGLVPAGLERLIRELSA